MKPQVFLTAVVFISGPDGLMFRDMQATMVTTHDRFDIWFVFGCGRRAIEAVLQHAQQQPDHQGDYQNAYQCHSQFIGVESRFLL